MKYFPLMAAVTIFSCVGCVSERSSGRFDAVAYGISIVEGINTPSELERIGFCAHEHGIRVAAKKRLAEVNDVASNEDAKWADIAIGLHAVPQDVQIQKIDLREQGVIFKEMLQTDDEQVWCRGVERIDDEKILAEIAIAAHPFGIYDGKVKRSVVAGGLRAVEKLRIKAYIEQVYERAMSNDIRAAAKAKR